MSFNSPPTKSPLRWNTGDGEIHPPRDKVIFTLIHNMTHESNTPFPPCPAHHLSFLYPFTHRSLTDLDRERFFNAVSMMWVKYPKIHQWTLYAETTGKAWTALARARTRTSFDLVACLTHTRHFNRSNIPTETGQRIWGSNYKSKDYFNRLHL